MIRPQLLHIFILNQWPSVRAVYQTEPPLFCTQCFYWELSEVSCSGKPLNVSLGWLESFRIISLIVSLSVVFTVFKNTQQKAQQKPKIFFAAFLSFKSYLWQFSNKISTTFFFLKKDGCMPKMRPCWLGITKSGFKWHHQLKVAGLCLGLICFVFRLFLSVAGCHASITDLVIGPNIKPFIKYW